MLQKASVESVITLAKKISESGLSMIPHQNTPLSIAVNESYSPIIDTAESADLYRLSECIQKASMRDAGEGCYPHDNVMETLVEMASSAVQKNILLARTVVNPQIKQVVDAVESTLSKAAIRAANPIAIIPDTFDGVWASPTLTSLVGRYEDVPVRDVVKPAYFGSRATDDVQGLLKSGSSAFDSEVAAWVEGLGVDFVMDVYNTVFAQAYLNESGPKLHDFLSTLRDNNPLMARNRALAVYLMARTLKDQPESEAGVDLSTFREVLTENMEQAGRMVAQAMARRIQETDAKLLLTSWPTTDTGNALLNGAAIVVNGECYTAWLNEGGSPEILLGSFVTDRETGYGALLAAGDRYKQEWERVLLMRKSQVNSHRFNTILQSLGAAITDIINGMADDDMVVINRAAYHARLREVLGTFGSGDFENLYTAARTALVFTLYAHTDAERILKAMDEILNQMPKLDVREAALYAVIDVVSSWVLSLIEVKPELTNTENLVQARAGAALITLANAVELGTQTVLTVAGNDISNHIEGQVATVGQVADAIALKIQSKLQHVLK